MKKVFDRLKGAFSNVTLEKEEFRGETTFSVNSSKLFEILSHLKKKEGFDFLLDISSVDYLEEKQARSGRFEIIYELLRLKDLRKVRVKSQLPEDNFSPKSVSKLWKTANWHEREVYDLMGIKFEDHPNLTRILMWEGYPHNPLRKDFPLSGTDTHIENLAFSKKAPLDGGPFVAKGKTGHVHDNEPKSLEN